LNSALEGLLALAGEDTATTGCNCQEKFRIEVISCYVSRLFGIGWAPLSRNACALVPDDGHSMSPRGCGDEAIFHRHPAADPLERCFLCRQT
jgi:hypothetical protein